MEWRGGVAVSYSVLDTDAFLFGEVVRREHEACARNRLEVGAGSQITDKLQSITQVWIERGDPGPSSDKVQTELIWRAGDADYSIGYREEVGLAFEEESLFIAYARRF